MIVKNIKPTKFPRPFGQLVRYLAAADEADEKLETLWAVNCDAGDGIDDLRHIINEVEATQRINIRCRADNNHHLVASFRDERPSPEVMADIERRLAVALKFNECQCVAATHINTEHYHMHVVYSRIHPKTHTKCRTDFPYQATELASRLAEKAHGLEAGHGRWFGPGAVRLQPFPRNRMTERSQDAEALTWERTFAGYVLELADRLDAARAACRTWQDLHDRLGKYGLVLKPKGQGLVVADAGHGGRMVKASSLGGHFGKPGLERHLGAFEPPARERGGGAKMAYSVGPATDHPGQKGLWEEYRAEKSQMRAEGRKLSWRSFLHARADTDPLARDIIETHKSRGREMGLEKGLKL